MREELTKEFFDKLAEIERLLTEAYEHYFAEESHAKSSEGWITLEIPPYFWKNKEKRVEVMIYSYALGPYRTHRFTDIDKALEEVKEWHKIEMENHG